MNLFALRASLFHFAEKETEFQKLAQDHTASKVAKLGLDSRQPVSTILPRNTVTGRLVLGVCEEVGSDSCVSQTGPRAWWQLGKQVNKWGSLLHSSSTSWDCLCASAVLGDTGNAVGTLTYPGSWGALIR